MADTTHPVRRWPDDPLGLRRVLGDRLLPVMVATMAFLAALALGGALAAQDWADRWWLGAGTALTAQIPRPDDLAAAAPGAAPGAALGAALGEAPISRLEQGLRVLRASPAIVSARPLTPAELDALLKPWLGAQSTVPGDLLPAVVAVRAAADPPGGAAGFDQLARALEQAVPDASLEAHTAWVGRLARLLRALEVCAWGALLLVAAAATLVIGTATRAGLVARRGTVDILHGLGATDGYVAARFAHRAMVLATLGAVAGTLAGLPVLLSLGHLARPLAAEGTERDTLCGDMGCAAGGGLPTALWVGLALIPPAAAAIGYTTAQATVRVWLRRLP